MRIIALQHNQLKKTRQFKQGPLASHLEISRWNCLNAVWTITRNRPEPHGCDNPPAVWTVQCTLPARC